MVGHIMARIHRNAFSRIVTAPAVPARALVTSGTLVFPGLAR
jgi:hypothetical protein